MKKTIDIDGKEVLFEATAITPIIYHNVSGGNLVKDMEEMDDGTGDAFLTVSILAGVMALQPGKTLTELMNISRTEVYEWLMGIDSPLALVEQAKDIMDVWARSSKTSVQSKKKEK